MQRQQLCLKEILRLNLLEAGEYSLGSISVCLIFLRFLLLTPSETGHWDFLGNFSVSIFCLSEAILNRVIMQCNNEVLNHLHGSKKKVVKCYLSIKMLNKHPLTIKCFGSCLRVRQWAEWLAEVSSSISF